MYSIEGRPTLATYIQLRQPQVFDPIEDQTNQTRERQRIYSRKYRKRKEAPKRYYENFKEKKLIKKYTINICLILLNELI